MRLMHCPFCGEEEKLQVIDVCPANATKWIRHNSYVQCRACDTQGPQVQSVQSQAVAKASAIDLWNNRMAHDEDLALRTAFRLS